MKWWTKISLATINLSLEMFKKKTSWKLIRKLSKMSARERNQEIFCIYKLKVGIYGRAIWF